jgi:hypothetical protein
MDIINTILECSGVCGLTNYRNMPLNEFINWFKNDISYNTIESRELGQKLIDFLSNSQHA